MGGVDAITILNGGYGYRVGDLTEFDDTGTNGSGFRAEVDEIVGIGISSINTNLTSFLDVVFEWKSGSEVVANYLPFIELNDKDAVSVSGLSSSIVNLTDSFNVGVKTERVGLAKSMTIGAAGGLIQDIFVTRIPNSVAIGGTLRIGSGNVSNANDIENLQVLNVYPLRKIIRVLRHTGIAHTLGSNIDVLNNQISIPVQTKKFDSETNDIIYFNSAQSVGIGTTPGGATSVDRIVGEIVERTSIPTRTIHIPNHPFKTGQKLTLHKRVGANRFDVGTTPLVTEFKLPFLGANATEVFVIDKGENNIGLVTTRVGIGSTSEGLFFYSKGSVTGISSGLYILQTSKDQ